MRTHQGMASAESTKRKKRKEGVEGVSRAIASVFFNFFFFFFFFLQKKLAHTNNIHTNNNIHTFTYIYIQAALKQKGNGSFVSKLVSRAINVYASLPEKAKSSNAQNTQEIACLAAELYLSHNTSSSSSSSLSSQITITTTLAKALMRQTQFTLAVKWLETSLNLLASEVKKCICSVFVVYLCWVCVVCCVCLVCMCVCVC